MSNLIQDAFNFIDAEGTISEYYYDNEYKTYQDMYMMCCNIVRVFTPTILELLKLEDVSIIFHYDETSSYRNEDDDTASLGVCEYTINTRYNTSMFTVKIFINNIIWITRFSPRYVLIMDLIETLAHELRHVYQHHYRLFPQEDNKSYENQDIEIDATKFADKFYRNYVDIIDNYIELYYPYFYKYMSGEEYGMITRRNIKRLRWDDNL